MFQVKNKQLILSLILVIGTIWYTLKDIPLRELIQSCQNISFVYLLAITLISWAEYLVRAWRFKILISPIKNLKMIESLSPLLIGTLGNLLPMRAGEVLRAYLLKQKSGIAFSGSLASIMVERTFDLLMLLILLISLLGLELGNISANFNGQQMSIEEMRFSFGYFVASVLVLVLGSVYLIVFQGHRITPLARWLISHLPEKWESKVKRLIKSFAQGLEIFKNLRLLTAVLILSLLDLLFLILTYYPLMLAFDFHGNPVRSLLLLAALIPVFMTLFPTPGFIGSVQAGAFFVLHDVMNESAVPAAGYGMVLWASGFIIQIVTATAFVFHAHLSIGQIIDLEQRGEDALEKMN